MTRLNMTLFIIFFAWVSFFSEFLFQAHYYFLFSFLVTFLIILGFKQEKAKSIFEKDDLPFWIFLVCMGSGIVLAEDRRVAIETFQKFILFLPTTFYLGKLLFRNQKFCHMIPVIICCFSFIVAMIGLLELIYGSNFIYEKYFLSYYYERYISVGRPLSTLSNPTILGTYLLFACPFHLILLKNNKKVMKIMTALSLMLGIVIMLLAGSRGVLISFVVMGTFYLWFQKKRKAALFALIGFIIFVSVCSFIKGSSFERYGFHRMVLGGGQTIFSKYRMDRIKMTGNILKQYPLTGVGFQHFRLRFEEFSKDLIKHEETWEFKIPDNMYLTFLSETGVIGFSGFAIFILSMLWRAGCALKAVQDENQKQFILVFLSVLVGFLVNMAVYELFYWIAPFFLFALLCGFLHGALKFDND